MASERLDYLVSKKESISRSAAVELIKNAQVKVNGSLQTKPSQKYSEEIDLEVENILNEPQQLDLKIIYEDDDCVVIDKPEGVLVHSKGVFSNEATVATWLSPKTTGFEAVNNRAGIVHRLDRGTSGVMLCAKNPEALKFFQKQFSSRKVKKVYIAIVEEELKPEEALIDIPIERNPKDPKRFRASNSGKPAQTYYKAVESIKKNNKSYSIVELQPRTGRTHQIRVHLAYMKHPIIGDEFYKGAKADRLYLHAQSLEITLPSSQRKVFISDLPASFSRPKIEDDE